MYNIFNDTYSYTSIQSALYFLSLDVPWYGRACRIVEILILNI